MVSLKPIDAHGFVDGFPQAVDAANGPVLRQCMPWVVGQVIAEQILLTAIEVLRWQLDAGHCLEWRDGLVPFDAGVLYRHVVFGVLSLHL